MKRIIVFFAVSLFLFPATATVHAQFIRENAFRLPMIAGEVSFLRNDTATALYADDFNALAKAWVTRNFPAAKVSNEKKQGSDQLEALVNFKIDDPYQQAPLYYQGTLHLKWKDQVIQIKLGELSYTPGHPKGKAKKNTGVTNVSFQVKQQVLSGADKLYPHAWDSLNAYGDALLDDFSKYIQSSAKNIL